MSNPTGRRRRTAFMAMGLAIATLVLAAVGVGPISPDFMPHSHCLVAPRHPGLFWVTQVSDALIAIPYYIIPGFLVLAAWRGYAPAPGLFYLFGAFVLACGTTHIFDVWVMWMPVYYMHAAIKAVTACISWLTVGSMVREARRATPAFVIVGRKLREAAEELRAQHNDRAVMTLTETLELLGAALQRLQPVGDSDAAS